jgi:hypothetical protein
MLLQLVVEALLQFLVLFLDLHLFLVFLQQLLVE